MSNGDRSKEMQSIIEVKNLTKYYKEVKAVDDISFQVEKGELFGFLGVNGAGKSTTINLLCTLFPPKSGSALICGFPLGKENEEIRRRIGVVYQNNCLDDRLTIKENLMLRGSFYEKNKQKLKSNLNDICEILMLEDILDRTFAKLSGGQKRRCEIARALMNQPEILFLDEPTTGLDPSTRQNVWKSVSTLRKELNMTVFLTTHYMEEAAKTSHIAVIDAGHIKEYGTPFYLKESYASDKLRLVLKDKSTVMQFLNQKGIVYKEKEEYISIKLEYTLSAIPILEELKEYITGFEVIQGSMDDVFLNVTGKTLD